MIQFDPLLGERKRIHIFLKGISPKVNLIALLDFELAYFKAAAKKVNHCATGTRPLHCCVVVSEVCVCVILSNTVEPQISNDSQVEQFGVRTHELSR